jgi:hypothetical protein
MSTWRKLFSESGFTRCQCYKTFFFYTGKVAK